VKFFQTDPVWDILFPPDRKFVVRVYFSFKKTLCGIFLFSQTDPVWDILRNKYINISDYSIKKLQRCTAHGLIFKNFPLLMFVPVTYPYDCPQHTWPDSVL